MNHIAGRWFLIGVLGLGLVGPLATPAVPVTARVQDILLQLAEHQPDAVVRIIVQKGANDSTEAEAAVERLGGVVTRDLGIINGFAAEIPASAINELAHTSTITWMSLDAVVNHSDAPATYWQEDFSFGSVSAQDLGAWLNGANWSQGAWTEIGESDGPVAGDVAISSFFSGEYEGLRLQGAARGLQGSVDLNNLASAQLTLAFRRKDLADTDWVSVQASTDGAAWSELGRISGPATDEELQIATYDLGAYLSTTLSIRLVTSDTFQPAARIYFDYARVDFASTLQQPVVDTFEGAQTNLLYLPLTLKKTTTAPVDAVAASELEAAQYGINWRYTYDTFDSQAFNNNVGNAAWETNWLEDDLLGLGPKTGNVQVYAGELWMDDYPETFTQPSLRREVNLAGAQQAYLGFSYRTTSGVDWNDRVALDISKNKGLTYTTLATSENVLGATSNWAYFDITPYVSADTVIRFRVISGYETPDESFVVDNVYVNYTKVCPSCVDTSRLSGASIQSVNADKLWNESPYRQGQDVAVAVVDSGISYHTDLYDDNWMSRVIGGVDFANDWAVDDLNGHGTHVAGIIGGDGYLSDGAYMGVAPAINLVDVKVLNDAGMGYLSDVVAGLQWVLENKATYNIRVVNLSLNSSVAESYNQSPLDAALEILWFNGVVVVVSAGNNGNNSSSTRGVLLPPANDPFLISVGAADDRGTTALTDDKLANFSAYGTTAGQVKPDLVAPGYNRVSLLSSEDSNLATGHPLNKVAGWAGNTYFKMSGTSMAAPVVAGAAALLLQDEPNLTPDQVKYRLIATANKNWGGYNPALGGAPYLDIYAAVKGTTTQSSNVGLQASQLLWTGSQPITWGSVNWNSVNWNSVNWNSVNWNSVNWNSVNWNSESWEP